MIPALSTAFTALSAGAVGWGLATGNVLALAPGLVALVCALPLQGLSYQVHAENRCPPYEDRRTPHQVLWHNPYNND